MSKGNAVAAADEAGCSVARRSLYAWLQVQYRLTQPYVTINRLALSVHVPPPRTVLESVEMAGPPFHLARVLRAQSSHANNTASQNAAFFYAALLTHPWTGRGAASSSEEFDGGRDSAEPRD